MGLRHAELADGLVVNLSGRNQSLDERDHELLRRARVVRVDPSNSCNASCVFCDSSFRSRGARLPLTVFEEALESIGRSEALHTLQFGCSFEPTIRKDLSAFGLLVEKARFARHPEILSLVSNCWLLHRHDVEPFVRAGMNKLHVSLHSHDREEFEAVMGHDELEQVGQNLKAFKSRFPEVPVSATFVVNTMNMSAPVDFARWAFFEVGVDYLKFVRAKIQGVQPASPALAFRERRPADRLELTDEEWSDFAARAEGVLGIGLELIDSRQNLKNSSVNVEALRVKQPSAPGEQTAMRRVRQRRLAELQPASAEGLLSRLAGRFRKAG